MTREAVSGTAKSQTQRTVLMTLSSPSETSTLGCSPEYRPPMSLRWCSQNPRRQPVISIHPMVSVRNCFQKVLPKAIQ